MTGQSIKRTETAERRKSDILDAALQVFSTKGFHRATNRDIAQAAGVASPGLIYHYFRDKQDLLAQVLERVNPVVQLVASPGNFLELPLREGLIVFASRFLDLARDPQRVAVMRLLVKEALNEPETASAVFAAAPARGLRLLTGFLERHQREGNLRAGPTPLLARQLVGPLLLAILFRALFGRQDPLPDPAWCVDVFLEGAGP